MSANSDFRDRLAKRLGRAPAAGRNVSPIAPSADVSGLRERLERTLRRGHRRRAKAREMAVPQSRGEVPPPTDLEVRSNAHGTFAERIVDVESSMPWGGLPLREALAIDPERLALWTAQGELSAIEPAGAVFLDTETTSLSGGAGTIVFLIGIGRFVSDRFRVHQVFLENPGQEKAALLRVRELLASSSWLVSFHGKSFDRHRIHARCAIHGWRSDLLDRPHLDLYHLGRKLWGRDFERTRLKDFERELLGFERVDDLPGAECPRAWFDHVRGERSPIGKVFEHNLVDIVSLAALTSRLTCYPRDVPSDWFVHAEALAREGRVEAACLALERSVVPSSPDVPSARHLERLARLAQRLGRSDLARTSWERLALEGHVEACLSLARLAERQDKDDDAALLWCSRARACDGQGGHAKEIERREKRLRSKKR